MAQHAALSADAHARLRVSTERSDRMGDAVMCALAVPDEFRRIAAHYPILFRLNLERDSFAPLAMFGFEPGENLFLGPDGWDAAYIPLSHDIQPFLIGGSPESAAGKQVHLDLDSARLGDAAGVRLFDEDRRPTPFLEAMVDKLGALDEGYRATAPFLDALQQHHLLEPLTLEVTLEDGTTNRLVGFHAIDEGRLRALDGAALGALHAAGHLMPIFMAVAALGRINDLVARKNRRRRDG